MNDTREVLRRFFQRHEALPRGDDVVVRQSGDDGGIGEFFRERRDGLDALREEPSAAPVADDAQGFEHVDVSARVGERCAARAFADYVPRDGLNALRRDRCHEPVLRRRSFAYPEFVLILHVTHQGGNRSRQRHECLAVVPYPPHVLVPDSPGASGSRVHERLGQQRSNRGSDELTDWTPVLGCEL